MTAAWTLHWRIGAAAMRAGLALAIVAAILAFPSRSEGQTQTVTATWDANSDGVTTGYRLYYGTSPTTYSSNIDVGNVTSRQLTLSPGTYYFTVRGYNAAGQQGPAADQATFTVGGSTPAPTATLTGSLVGTNVASLTWATTNATAVTLNGAAVALSGTTQFTINSATTYTLVATGAGGSITRTATVTPIPVDCVMSAWTLQSATAWSACTGGQQSRTETWTRTIITPASGGGAACGPLTEQRVVTQACTMPPTATFTGTLSGSSTAVLTWQTTGATSVTINGAGVALSGTVSYTISAQTTYTLVASGPGGSVTRTATVTPAPVDCVVSAWTLQSATAWSACAGGLQSRTETWTRTVIVPPANGGAACPPLQENRVVTQSCTATPTAPAPPMNVQVKVSGQVATLSWTANPNGGAPDRYLVSIGTTPGGSNVANSLDVGNVLTVTSDRLPKGSYYARVKAANSVGTSADSTEVSFRIGAKGKPRTPGALSGSFDSGTATLSWSPPAIADGNDGATGYVVEAGSAPGLSDLAVIALDGVTSFQAESVPAGVYYVRVRAVNDDGFSDPSNEIVLSPFPIIGAPQDLSDSGSEAVVSLTWEAPRSGGTAAGYLVEAGSRSGLADLAVLRLSDTTSFATIAPPGIYYVRVRAVDASGRAGEASNEIVVRR